MFACEHARVRPDFICLSKGITSGALPLGATLTTERVYRAFCADDAQRKTFYHGHTYTANPIACAAALASLRVFEEENTLARVRGLLPQFRDGLERFRSLPIVGNVRQIGLIGAIELVKDRRTKEPFGARERIGLKIYREGLRETWSCGRSGTSFTCSCPCASGSGNCASSSTTPMPWSRRNVGRGNPEFLTFGRRRCRHSRGAFPALAAKPLIVA